MKALAIKQFNKNPEQLSQMLEQNELLLITKQEQPLGMVIPFSSNLIDPSLANCLVDYIRRHENQSLSLLIPDVFKFLLNLEQQRLDENAAVTELEKAYRDAAQEFDTHWEITASDGLTNERW
jgi:hypothetical protein